MRIAGRRTDGAMYVTLGGGIAVILKGNRVTPPLDQLVVERMGPWEPAENGWQARRDVVAKLHLARVGPLPQFQLGQSFHETRVLQALRSRFGHPADALFIPRNGIGEDWVVFLQHGQHYGVGYDLADGTVTFDGEPVEVSAVWEGDEPPAEVRATTFYARFTASQKKSKAITRLLS